MKVLAQKCQHCVQALWIREGFTTWFFIKAHAIIWCHHSLATWSLVQSTMLLGLIGSGVDVILWPWVLASRQFGTADGCTLKCGRCPEARATMIDHFYYPIQEQFLLYIAEQIKVQPWWPECSRSYRNWEGADEVSLNKSKKHTCVSMCFQGTCSRSAQIVCNWQMVSSFDGCFPTFKGNTFFISCLLSQILCFAQSVKKSANCVWESFLKNAVLENCCHFC